MILTRILRLESLLAVRLLAFVSAILLSRSGALAFPADQAIESKDAAPAVTVVTRREGEETHFLVENKELCEVTMTFQMTLVNLKSSACFPCAMTFPAGKTTEAFMVEPQNCDQKWEYSYTNFYKLGSNVAVHDDLVEYQLPFAAGTKFKVTQGYNGSFSHKGSNLYAIDWQMAEGTPVYAARGGLVVKVRDDSDKGGESIKFDKFNNYVLIRHDDGTLGHYCHLKKAGVVVKPGQVVRAGQLIAHSGNTGFSSGPHLHFSVFKTKDGKDRMSIPVKFKTADDEVAITLKEGRRYRAANVATVVATAPRMNSAANTPSSIGQ